MKMGNRDWMVVRLMLLVVVGVSVAQGLVHKLGIHNDPRKHFFIENFGFVKGGVLSMQVENWKMGKHPYAPENPETGPMAFYIHVTETDSTAYLDENAEIDCLLNKVREEVKEDTHKSHLVYPNTQTNVTIKEIIIPESQEGFYNVYFLSCAPESVSFTLKLEQYNVDSAGRKDYLSAGLSQLPTLYGVFTAIYVGLLVVWLFGFMRAEKVNRVHYLMTILVALKIFSLLFQAIEMHFTKTTGDPGGWQVAYFVFAGLKTSFFFVLVALIGTGWTFVKPFLSEKDKKIIAVVIPMQILDNVAMIIVDYTAPGSQGWFTWKDIFRLVDIICCGAVLIPIIWSIKHLREASQIDGKVARNLQKLKLFRQFYLIVVSYIYFTRIIIFLLDATLPFKIVWMGEMFSELASLSFFLIVGYKFSPSDDNPYFKLDMDDDAARLEAMEQRDED